MNLWVQNYDPLGNPVLSTAVAALPVVVLLGLIAFGGMSIHRAAVIGLLVALAVAVFAFGMPVMAALASAAYGSATGLFPIGWIILNLLFLYELTLRRGLFEVLRDSLSRVAPDPRVQVILIAFCFGAFFEGAAGFGTPVAVTSAILVRLGFRPLEACGLSLIANTAPVAFGALGTPILTLAEVTGLDAMKLSIMVGRQLPFFSVLVPFWCVWAMAGFRGLRGVWPVALVAGLAFAIPQFLVSNFHGPALVDIIASLTSIAAVLACLKCWRPRDSWTSRTVASSEPADAATPAARRRAWMPWIVLSLLVFLWGLSPVKQVARSNHGAEDLRPRPRSSRGPLAPGRPPTGQPGSRTVQIEPPLCHRHRNPRRCLDRRARIEIPTTRTRLPLPAPPSSKPDGHSSPSPACSPSAPSPNSAAPMPPWASPWPKPACSIRSLAHC